MKISFIQPIYSLLNPLIHVLLCKKKGRCIKIAVMSLFWFWFQVTKPSIGNWLRNYHGNKWELRLKNEERAFKKLARIKFFITNAVIAYATTEWVIAMIACFLKEECYEPLRFYAVSWNIFKKSIFGFA